MQQTGMDLLFRLSRNLSFIYSYSICGNERQNFELDITFCSILYNRGLYPEESFARVKKYGLPLLLTQDEGVKSFISNLTSQLSGKNFS